MIHTAPLTVHYRLVNTISPHSGTRGDSARQDGILATFFNQRIDAVHGLHSLGSVVCLLTEDDAEAHLEWVRSVIRRIRNPA
jgi:hypothetical protein